ncbi:MAG: riboflavin synthase [Chloroflexota bacterium]|nr:riboflavin synthase [Chloroflexota bacterium]
MFTGIVEEIGTIKSIGQGRIVISAHKVLEGTVLGDSIAVNGACLTVIEIGEGNFAIEIMPETLRRTSLGALHSGEQVNLERALAVGGRMGGHFVQGHVDGTGKILSLDPDGDAILMKVAAPAEIRRYAVEKGFIAVEGISLTIFKCDTASFSVSLVGYTRHNTTLGTKKPGDPLNLEVDIIAKYVEQLTGGGQTEITPEFLSKHGFV